MVVESDWRSLGSTVGSGFDALLCTGNALGHLDAESMEEVFAEFARVLEPGGRVITDTHHWGHVIARGDCVLVEPELSRRGASTCRRTYTWDMPRSSERERTCDLTIGLEIDDGSRVRVRHHRFQFHPFETAQLFDRARRGGFGDIWCDADPDDDRYSFLARRL